MGLSGEAGDPSASGEGAVADSAVAVSLSAEKWDTEGGRVCRGSSGDYLEKTLRFRGGRGGGGVNEGVGNRWDEVVWEERGSQESS